MTISIISKPKICFSILIFMIKMHLVAFKLLKTSTKVKSTSLNWCFRSRKIYSSRILLPRFSLTCRLYTLRFFNTSSNTGCMLKGFWGIVSFTKYTFNAFCENYSKYLIKTKVFHYSYWNWTIKALRSINLKLSTAYV